MSSAKDRKVIAVGVRSSGDTKFGFNFVNGSLKHVTVEVCNVAMKTIGTHEDTRDRWYDLVETRGCIIAELNVRIAVGEGVVHLKDLKEDRVMCASAGPTSVTSCVE